MDAQYGVSLTVNGRASYTVAIGPNIALDLQISPSRGAVLVNNYLVESQQRTQVSTINAIRNGCLLYTSPSPRDATLSRMPSSA